MKRFLLFVMALCLGLNLMAQEKSRVTPICSQCGTPLKPGMAFCGSCGTKMQ